MNREKLKGEFEEKLRILNQANEALIRARCQRELALWEYRQALERLRLINTLEEDD